jgi:putative ABC transport system permease protein
MVPQLAPALGFLALGCIASLAGALYPAYLNRMQPLAQALKTVLRRARLPAGSARRRLLLPMLLALGVFGLTRLPPLFDLPLAGYAAIALVLGSALPPRLC